MSVHKATLAGLCCLGLLACHQQSPFAPAAELSRCGAESEPCGYSCDLDCATRIVAAANASCVSTLEGELDTDRRRCRFGDGSEATFETALPFADPLVARHYPINMTLRRSQSTCLELRVKPPDVNGASRIEVGGQVGRYVQQLRETPTDAGTSDARPSDAAVDRGVSSAPLELEVQCGDRTYRAQPPVCERCATGCTLLQADLLLSQDRRSRWQTVELRLRAGGAVAALFSCTTTSTR